MVTATKPSQQIASTVEALATARERLQGLGETHESFRAATEALVRAGDGLEQLVALAAETHVREDALIKRLEGLTAALAVPAQPVGSLADLIDPLLTQVAQLAGAVDQVRRDVAQLHDLQQGQTVAADAEATREAVAGVSSDLAAVSAAAALLVDRAGVQAADLSGVQSELAELRGVIGGLVRDVHPMVDRIQRFDESATAEVSAVREDIAELKQVLLTAAAAAPDHGDLEQLLQCHDAASASSRSQQAEELTGLRSDLAELQRLATEVLGHVAPADERAAGRDQRTTAEIVAARNEIAALGSAVLQALQTRASDAGVQQVARAVEQLASGSTGVAGRLTALEARAGSLSAHVDDFRQATLRGLDEVRAQQVQLAGQGREDLGQVLDEIEDLQSAAVERHNELLRHAGLDGASATGSVTVLPVSPGRRLFSR